MSNTPPGKAYPPLPDDTILYRAVTNAKMVTPRGILDPVTGNELTPLALVRRHPLPDGQLRDIDGFSVTLANGRSEAEIIEQEKARKPRAICSFTVGQVRALNGLRLQDGTVVSVDVLQDQPDHANIVGLPTVPEEPPTPATADAVYLGGELAKRARILWRK